MLLGTFPGKSYTKLVVELTVPIELGNEYANRVGEVDWVFTAEEVKKDARPQTGDDSSLLLWAAVMTVSFLAAAVVILSIRSKNRWQS